jgi:DNA helicase-2/ATP-dependent DNA helicase PcrA
VPYAYPRLREQLEAAATKVLSEYLRKHGPSLSNLEYSEKQIEINLGDGISVTGRIDLVKRLDTNETTIVDLKSSDRAQTEEVTETQLHVYALGYQELTGTRPDYVEIHELDADHQKRRSVDDDFIADVKTKTRAAATALRASDLPAVPADKKCAACDYLGMCTKGRTTVSSR